MLIIEVLAVIGAILVLTLSAILLLRNAIGFGRTVRSVAADVEPRALHIMEQADAAQRRGLAINNGQTRLMSRLLKLKVSLGKLKVSISAGRDAWEPVAKVLRYVGL